jgi:GGDEF domain-containing protein
MMKYDWKIVFYARRRQASRRSHGHVVKVLTEDKFVGATISIGVAVLDSHGSDLGELLKLADRALYRPSERAATGCLASQTDSDSPVGER